MILENNCLKFTHFSCSITAKFIASTLLVKFVQKDQNTLIKQSKIVVTALLEYLNHHACFMLPSDYACEGAGDLDSFYLLKCCSG